MPLDPEKQVPAERTPLTPDELRAALITGHQTIRAGALPSRNVLRFAWAHVCHETNGTASAWCFNLGNLKATESWPGAWCSIAAALKPGDDEPPNQRAYATALQGANDYWRLMFARYTRALAEADRGDLHNAAVALRESGYMTAEPVAYGDALERWAGKYDEQWPERAARRSLVVGLVLAAVAVGLFVAAMESK
jgi:hypothetical protein